MKTKITIGVIALFAIGAVWIVAANRNSGPTPSMGGTTSAPHETTNPNATSTGKVYTLAHVAAHKDATSCWTAINGKVYDVTSWIDQHPGGRDAILSLCGKDGSSAFNDQHGGQRRPAQELASFYIGDLTQ
jgi:cytochrome b involved in lipid metabolism